MTGRTFSTRKVSVWLLLSWRCTSACVASVRWSSSAIYRCWNDSIAAISCANCRSSHVFGVLISSKLNCVSRSCTKSSLFPVLAWNSLPLKITRGVSRARM